MGSFLNVCAYRIPLGRSVVFPGSHCAACGAPIPSYNKIPVLSWLILRGRAACCQTRIDARYCVVELMMGLLFAALWNRYSSHPLDAVFYAIFISGLTVSSLIDLDHFFIPDRFTMGGVVVGVLACSIDPSLMDRATASQGFGWSLVGALIGGMTLLAIGNAGTLLFKKEAMGFGDVKLAAAICSFLGGESITYVLPMSAICGSVLGIAIIYVSKGSWATRIPYGPFLAMGSVLWLFGGKEWMTGYWDNLIHNFQSYYFTTPQG